MSKLTVIVVFTMALVVTTAAQKSIYNKPYERWTIEEALAYFDQLTVGADRR